MARCYSCMQQYDGEYCTNCGYKNGSETQEHYYLSEGTVLQDRYTVGRVLGHGGFGITYIGHDDKFDMVVAIKEYLPSDISTRALGETTVTTFSGDKYDAYVYGLGRFIDEAKTLAHFAEYPSIVSVKDYFRQNNTAYIVMEYLDGITLSEYIKQSDGKMSEKETLSVIKPIIDALRQVHASGIIHRDISPDNIYITKSGQIKLLDFGAARHAMGEKSKSLSVVLKPGYAPPEQYYTRGKQGPWTDVYAIAATMYRMLTGQAPPESMERMAEDTLTAPEGVSPYLSQVLMHALRLKNHERFQSIQALYNAIYKAVDVQTQPAHYQTQPTQAVSAQPEKPQTVYHNSKPQEKPVPQEDDEQEKIWADRLPDGLRHFINFVGVLALAGLAIWIWTILDSVYSLKEYDASIISFATLSCLGIPIIMLLYRTFKNIVTYGVLFVLFLIVCAIAMGTMFINYFTYHVFMWLFIIAIIACIVLMITKQKNIGKAGIWIIAGTAVLSIIITSIIQYNSAPVARYKDTNINTGYNITRDDLYIANADVISLGNGSRGHIVAIEKGGHLRSEGSDRYGQRDIIDMDYVVSVSCGSSYTLALRQDGSVVACGLNDDGQCDVLDWRSIVAINAGAEHSVGLRADGTVVAAGNNNYGQCDVSGWYDIVQVDAGYDATVGLKSDGTVVVAGSNGRSAYSARDWEDIVQVVATATAGILGLKSDGTLICTEEAFDVSDYHQISRILDGQSKPMALTTDGILVDLDSGDIRCEKAVDAWAGYSFDTIALLSDGSYYTAVFDDVHDWDESYMMLPPWLSDEQKKVIEDARQDETVKDTEARDEPVDEAVEEPEGIVFESKELEEKIRWEIDNESDPIYSEDLEVITSLDVGYSGTYDMVNANDINLLPNLDLFTINYDFLIEQGNDLNELLDINEDVNIIVRLEPQIINDDTGDQDIDYDSILETALNRVNAIDGVYLEWPDVEAVNTCIEFYRRNNQLTHLIIDEWWNESDGRLQRHIEDIGDLTQLEFLILMSNDIENINALRNLDSLEYLEIRGSTIKNFSPYEELDNLQEFVN